MAKNKPKRKPRKVKEPDKNWVNDVMTNNYKLARWAALFEAIDVIHGHSLARNKKFNDLDLKPLAIQKYVDTKADDILQEIQRGKI
jgi:hypothetical protein